MRIAMSLVAAVTLAAAGLPAAAASFDCAKAAAPDEIAICADPTLSALDSEMGGLWFAYSRIPFLMGMAGNRQDEARDFLARRAACGPDVRCLTASYHDRIATLKQQLAAGMQQYCTQ